MRSSQKRLIHPPTPHFPVSVGAFGVLKQADGRKHKRGATGGRANHAGSTLAGEAG